MDHEIKTRDQLLKLLDGDHNTGVHKLKPRVLLEILEEKESPSQREFSLIYPPVTIGSPSIFEVSIIALLVRLFAPTKIVEIGTFMGYTAAILAKNSPDNAKVISIDLPSAEYMKDAPIACRKEFLEKTGLSMTTI